MKRSVREKVRTSSTLKSLKRGLEQVGQIEKDRSGAQRWEKVEVRERV